MPLHRYICKGCGHSFRKLKRPGKNGDDPQCPKCNSENVERTVSKTIGIRFKGNGFYRTDYKNDGSVSGNGNDGNAGGNSADDD